MTTGSRCEEAKWTLRLFYSLFSVPQPIAYVRQLIARVTVAIMITPRKLCGFRGEKKKHCAISTLEYLDSTILEKKKKNTHTHTKCNHLPCHVSSNSRQTHQGNTTTSEKGQSCTMEILTRSVHTDCSRAMTAFELQSHHTSAWARKCFTFFLFKNAGSAAVSSL